MARKKSSAKRERVAPAVEVPADQHRVIVEGREPRMQTFNLPHEIYCAKMGSCSCTEQEIAFSVYSQIEGGKTRRIQRRMKRMNPTLTVRYRKRTAIPKAALACPEVKAALDAGWIRVRS